MSTTEAEVADGRSDDVLVDYPMPSLGADMERGTLIEWRVEVGQRIRPGDVVALIDTEKSDLEIESFHAGTIVELLLAPGETAPVGAVIARYRAADARLDRPARPDESADPDPAGPPGPMSSPQRRDAPDSHVLAAALAGLRPGSTARHHGLSDGDPPTSTTTPSVRSETTDRAVSLRRRIATQMAKSKREIPHYQVATDIDMRASLDWLHRHNETHDIGDRLLAAALLLAAVARAAATHPDLNGWFVDDRYEPTEHVHLGVAVSLRGGGLVAPAILDADRHPVQDLMTQLRDLVARARAGRLRSNELTSPTITVTNLGEQGVEVVHPIINPPQVAMVGFGRITERPAVVDGEVVVRPLVTATVAADHRVSDGLVAGRFLTAVDHLLQRPAELS